MMSSMQVNNNWVETQPLFHALTSFLPPLSRTEEVNLEASLRRMNSSGRTLPSLNIPFLSMTLRISSTSLICLSFCFSLSQPSDPFMHPSALTFLCLMDGRTLTSDPRYLWTRSREIDPESLINIKPVPPMLSGKNELRIRDNHSPSPSSTALRSPST